MKTCFRQLSFIQIETRLKWILMLFAILLVCQPAFSQSKKELEKKKELIQKDIDYTNQLLSQTKKSKSNSLVQLVTLNKKITYRSELIGTINSQLHVVEKEIGNVSMNIDSLNKRLSDLKQEYATMLFYAYRNQNAYSKLMFIFSADGFNQAYKRMLYLRELSNYRLRQRDLIVQFQDSLNGKKHKLQDVKTDKKVLLTSQERQIRELGKEKKEQVEMLNTLASRERKLRGDLKEKQKKQQQLSSKIEEIIKKEIAAARIAAKKKSASSATASKSTKKLDNTNSSILSNTPEALKLSNDFENNKGRLPWPVEKGIISSSFGRHSHPLWKDVVINNNGVDINSTKGAKATALFDGKVIYVFMVVDKYAVLVQHGEYFTLYSNLEKVFVKVEDKVMTKQPIGVVQTNEDDGKTELHLEIWRGSNKMDPEAWIASR